MSVYRIEKRVVIWVIQVKVGFNWMDVDHDGVPCLYYGHIYDSYDSAFYRMTELIEDEDRRKELKRKEGIK
jgi:hypothetical protein